MSTPKPARVFFSDLLETKMLKAKHIDVRGIYQDYHGFAKKVSNSVRESDTSFLKPGGIKQLAGYKKPYQQQGVRAAYWWNALYPDFFINQGSTFKILSLNEALFPPTTISRKEVDEHTGDKVTVYDPNPEFDEFIKTIFDAGQVKRIHKMFKEHPELRRYGMGSIAIPLGIEEIPEELVEYADIGNITNFVISKGNILLESLGFVLVKSRDRAIVANVIKI